MVRGAFRRQGGFLHNSTGVARHSTGVASGGHCQGAMYTPHSRRGVLSLLCIVPAVGTGRKLFCLVPTVGTGMELMWTYVPYSWARAEDGTFAGRALGHEPGCIGCSRGIGGNPNNGPRVGDGGTHVPVDPIAGLWG